MSKENQTLTIEQNPLQLRPAKASFGGLRTHLLKKLGLRSECCGARIVVWYRDKLYCEACDGWLFRSPQQ